MLTGPQTKRGHHVKDLRYTQNAPVAPRGDKKSPPGTGAAAVILFIGLVIISVIVYLSRQ